MATKEIRIEITRNTMAGGKPVKVGQKITLPEKEATLLMHIGKAKLAESAAPAEKPNTKPAAEKNKPGKPVKEQKAVKPAKDPAPDADAPADANPETKPEEGAE